MILYSIALSPFGARARLALRIKRIEHDMRPPPGGGPRSPDFLAINPVGKIPVLVTDDGLVIAESETIIDYLEDHYPTPSLLPRSDADRARMRNIVRLTELYATPALFRLFAQIAPDTRDIAIVTAEVERLCNGLALVDRFVSDAPFAVGDHVSKADCILLPTLLLIDVVAKLFALENPVDALPALSGYRDKARQIPELGAIWTETDEALAAAAAA